MPNNNKWLTFNDLIAGDCVRLINFGDTNAGYRRLLLSIGLTIGVEITVIRVAPFGCPIQISLRGTMMALRKHEAQYLYWERI